MLNKDCKIIPLENSINNWYYADKFLNILSLLNQDCIIIFDLKTLTSLKPSGIIMLINLIEIASKYTKEKILIESINDELLAYLEKIKFFTHFNNKCEVNFDKVTSISNNWINSCEIGEANNTYMSGIELIHIQDRMELNTLYERLKTILDIWFPDKRYSKFRINILNSIYEACDNSIEHSNLDNSDGECFLMLLKNYGVKEIEVQIVVGDIGIGIKNHLSKKYGEFSDADSAYIEKALKEYSTGRLDDRGGMGLKDISDIVQECNGKLVIMSSKGIISIGDKILISDNKFSILGTQIEISLKYNKKYVDL